MTDEQTVIETTDFTEELDAGPGVSLAPVAVQAAPSVSIFGDDVEGALDKIDEIAKVLTQRIRDNGWMQVIEFNKGKANETRSEHVRIEGWTLAAALAGLMVGVDWTRKIKVNTVSGWQAHAIVRTLGGVTVSEGRGMCLRNERRWKDADEFHVEGMAKTRARGDALEGVLRFLIEQAGFAGTPAEKMDGVTDVARGPRTADRADTKKTGTGGGTASTAQVGKLMGTLERVIALQIEEKPQVRESYAAKFAEEYKFPMPVAVDKTTGETGPDFRAFFKTLTKKDASALIDRLVEAEKTLTGAGEQS